MFSTSYLYRHPNTNPNHSVGKAQMNCDFVTSTSSPKYYGWGSVSCNNDDPYCAPFIGAFCYGINVTDPTEFQVCNTIYSSGTGSPSLEPTREPTSIPTYLPSAKAGNPTGAPRSVPSYIPTLVPSAFPSFGPTVVSAPTFPPTPTPAPTTYSPTCAPTFSSPTFSPSMGPTYMPVSFSCSQGFYMQHGSTNVTNMCVPCPAGTYDNTIGQADSCSACLLAYTSQPFATACTPCPVGFYGYSTTQCLQCPAGTYSAITGKFSY